MLFVLNNFIKKRYQTDMFELGVLKSLFRSDPARHVRRQSFSGEQKRQVMVGGYCMLVCHRSVTTW